MMWFLENIWQKLIRLHRRQAGLALLVGKFAWVSPGWRSRTTVWPNCLLSLLSPSHSGHLLELSLPTTSWNILPAVTTHGTWDSLLWWCFISRWCWCLMLFVHYTEKINGGCWPERIKYSQTISSPPQSSSVCDCVGRYMWRMHCEPFNTNSV